MTKEKRVLGWHFLRVDGKLGNGDGRVVKAGKTYSVLGDILICEHGLHASKRIIDALQFALGPIICRVEVWGGVQEQSDKICGRHRRVITMADCTNVLHEFACRCAENALAKIGNSDPRSVTAIQSKRDWIAGKISNSDLAAARDAAWDAARDAARAAASAAAWDAAWDAASAAASAAVWDAAWDAARDAARAAASAAAWDAAWDAASAAASAAVWDAARAAASAAARDAASAAASAAARDAARDAQNKSLTAMVTAQLRRHV